MVISTQTGPRINILSPMDCNRRVQGNSRAHSQQDPIIRSRADLHQSLRDLCPIRNRINARKGCNFVDPTNDELATTLLLEVDTDLLTGELDQDIEILNSVA